MEGQPSENYEERLYSVFKSFDVNNEEALDKSAVHNLCDALQLEERGAVLVDTLFKTRTGRVTFSQFRSGLLAVLGNGAPAVDPSPPSDDDSSGREVAPRFVFGSKKYGRRSRPQPGAPAVAAEPRASSASRLTASPPRPRARRSASAMEAREAPLEHDARIDRERALALCRDLRMDAIDARLVDRVFDEASAPDTTVGEFFERLNATLANSVEEATSSPRPDATASAAVDDDDDDYNRSSFPVDVVIEAWEGAGLRRPRRLLTELGFTGASVPIVELEEALEDEQRAAAAPCPATVVAALALARLCASRATSRAARLLAERDKLRGDVAAGERRALLLAQEVDESHARLEAELRETLRRTDARHAEETRRAAREAAVEAERVAAERARLDGEAARRDEAEAELRAALAAALARARSEEARALAAEEARATLARDRDELAAALRGAEARAARAEAEAAAAPALSARLDEAVRENARLRDRMEELATELAAPRASDPPASLPPAAGSLRLELQEAQATRTGGAGADEAGDTAREDDDDEKVKLIELVRELETSLEAMRGEYEACEEYWAGKLREERAAADAEATAAGARLADLTARVADFERRLRPAAPAPALAPIAEQAALEAQVAALEAELAAARRAPPAPAPAPAPARPRAPAACARCARTAARADAAVRRLSARLAAADLLVKDLYVENCELASRRACLAAPL